MAFGDASDLGQFLQVFPAHEGACYHAVTLPWCSNTCSANAHITLADLLCDMQLGNDSWRPVKR